jgi:hypothetical protein
MYAVFFALAGRLSRHSVGRWPRILNKIYPLAVLQVSEKSGTNGNLNYFSYFYLQVKVEG